MLRKIEQLIFVSLKFFFDVDDVFCHYALLMALVSISVIKLFLMAIPDAFADSWQMVKDDFVVIKVNITAYKEQWENSKAYEVLTNNLRELKNSLPENTFQRWRLD